MSPRSVPGRPFAKLIAAAALVLSAHQAQAQSPAQPDDARAVARDLFQRGVHAAARGDYDTAVEHFEAALHVRSAPSIVYNLASALFELGRYPEAYEALTNLDRSAASDDIRARTETLAVSLRVRLAMLSVHSAEPELTLRIDGVAFALPAPTESLPLLPGSHVVEVLRGARPVIVRTVELARGVHFELDVVHELPRVAEPAPAPRVGPLVPADMPPSVDAEREVATRRRRIIGLSVAAGAIVAVAIAVPLAMHARPQRSDDPPATSGLSPGVLSW